MAVERVVGVLEPAPVEAGEERARALEVLPEELVQPREEQRAELASPGSRAQKRRTLFSRKMS